MGDPVGDLAHPDDEALDPVEHGVDVAGELAELVRRLCARDPGGEIALLDLGGDPVDRNHAPDEPAGEHRRPEAADDEEGEAGRREHGEEAVEDDAVVGGRVADGELEAAGEHRARAEEPVGAAAGRRRREGAPFAVGDEVRRPGVDVADEPAARLVEEEIDRGGRRIAGEPRLDRLAERRQPPLGVEVGEAGEVGRDQRPHPPVEVGRDDEVDGGEHRCGGDEEGEAEDQRQPDEGRASAHQPAGSKT